MKKVLSLLLGCFIAFGAVKAMADSRTDALNLDQRFVDDIDLIWFYPNLVTQYKNTVDYRTNYLSTSGQWGGFLDGQHTDLGTIGAYVYRPAGYDGTRGWNWTSPGWFGVGSGWYGSSWNVFQNRGYWAGQTYNLTASTPENKVDLFWGNSFDKTTFGVQVNYADNQPGGTQVIGGVPFAFNGSTSNNVPAAAQSSIIANNDARVLGVNLGLGTTDFGPFSSANFHLGYFMGTLNLTENNTPGGATAKFNNSLKDNGISTITAGALLNHDMDQNSNIKVFGDVYVDSNNQTESLSNDSNNDGNDLNNAGDVHETWTGKYSDIVATLGLGCNHKVLDGKATISSGVQVYWVNSDFKNSGSTQNNGAANATVVDVAVDEFNSDIWDIAWNASVEGKVASWLTLRAGINRPIIWRTTNVTTNNTNYAGNNPQSVIKTTTTADSYFGNNGSTYSLGFGVNFENWELDAVTSVASVNNSITNVAPGNGILFSNGSAIVTNYNADIRYRF